MTTFRETICPGVEFSVAPDRMIFAGETRYQTLHVFEHATLGSVLALDHVVQTTTSDEFIYHEMLVHTALLSHAAPEDVLIIGGGDGGTLREVLRHPIRSATMVELDVDVVRHCREHMPSLSAGAFDDPRTHLLFGDGAAFVADTSAQFDIIIIDSTDPIGPGRVLFEEPFFRACNSRLRNGGIMVNQNGTPAFMPEALRDSDRVLGQVFNHHGFFYVPVPTYVSGVMALGWASDSRNLAVLDREWLERRAAATRLETRWYTPATHLGAFAEPPVYTALRSGR